MAAQAGISRRQLTSWVDEGVVRRVLRGVYQRADEPDDQLNRAHASALVMRPFGILCDRSAAWIHGVDTLQPDELDLLPPLETFVLRDCARVRRNGCRGGERDLTANDLMMIGAICLTTPLRTALDLGCRLSRRDALAALDGFMRVHGITREEMQAELPRYRGRRGVVQLRRLIRYACGLAESSGESWTRMCIIDEGLPAPRLQYWVRDGGRKKFRLDMAYPEHKLAIEYDGAAFHDSPAQRRRDKQRRAWLRSRGWTVIVVRRDSFQGDALLRWLADVRKSLVK